jgi:hypothetical protein
MITEQEKAQIGAETLKNFLNQFGKDEIGDIFLEILLEEILNDKTIHLPCEQKQTGDQNNHNPKGQ